MIKASWERFPVVMLRECFFVVWWEDVLSSNRRETIVFSVQLPDVVGRFLLNQLDGFEATIKVRANRILLVVCLDNRHLLIQLEGSRPQARSKRVETNFRCCAERKRNTLLSQNDASLVPAGSAGLV
jgi:hypothetical protein